MTTQMHRIFTVLMVAIMVGLVAAGWFLVAQPQLAAAAASNDQLGSVQSQISTSQAALGQLREQKGKLGELTDELTGLQASIPSTLASSSLVADLDQEAAAAGVTITNIAVTDAVAYSPATSAGAPAASTSSSSATPAPTASATPTPSPTAAPGKSSYSATTDPQITAANFIPVPVAISIEGGWDQTLAFVKNLQSGDRLYAVGTLGVKGDDSGNGVYKTTVTGYVFALIDPTVPGAGTGAAAKAATATPSPTSTKKAAPTASATPESSQTESPTPTPAPTR
jgi:Tfp pilus assembly protein PilO